MEAPVLAATVLLACSSSYSGFPDNGYGGGGGETGTPEWNGGGRRAGPWRPGAGPGGDRGR